MFEYVTSNKKNWPKADQMIYKSYYYGIRHSLRKKIGTKGNNSLNSDMTFLAILLSGIYEPKEKSDIVKSIIPPFRKYKRVHSEVIDYVSDMYIILDYYNLYADFVRNRNILKKRKADLIKPYIGIIKNKYERQIAAIEKAFMKFDEAERSGEDNLSLVSNFSGEMYQKIFCFKIEDKWSKDLSDMGFAIGKFIYILNAYEDIERDIKRKHYNPIVKSKRFYKVNFETFIKQLISTELKCARECFSKFTIKKNYDVLNNMLNGTICHKKNSQNKNLKLKKFERIEKKIISTKKKKPKNRAKKKGK